MKDTGSTTCPRSKLQEENKVRELDDNATRFEPRKEAGKLSCG